MLVSLQQAVTRLLREFTAVVGGHDEHHTTREAIPPFRRADDLYAAAPIGGSLNARFQTSLNSIREGSSTRTSSLSGTSTGRTFSGTEGLAKNPTLHARHWRQSMNGDPGPTRRHFAASKKLFLLKPGSWSARTSGRPVCWLQLQTWLTSRPHARYSSG